jgi:hypothetical protein
MEAEPTPDTGQSLTEQDDAIKKIKDRWPWQLEFPLDMTQHSSKFKYQINGRFHRIL